MWRQLLLTLFYTQCALHHHQCAALLSPGYLQIRTSAEQRSSVAKKTSGPLPRLTQISSPLMSSGTPSNNNSSSNSPSPSSTTVTNDAIMTPTMQITTSAAEIALAAAESEAKSNKWAVTICISDAGGTPILTKRLNNAFAASYEIAVGKAKSAAMFCKKTSVLESIVNVSDGGGRASMLSSPFVLMGGGVPFVVNGVCCGAVGVSGVKPDQDEMIASVAITALESSLSKL